MYAVRRCVVTETPRPMGSLYLYSVVTDRELIHVSPTAVAEQHAAEQLR